MKHFFLGLMLLTLTSCTLTTDTEMLGNDPQSVFITNFDSFGPSMYSVDLLGYKHWSWNRTAGHIPKNHPIKVVIYKDISLTSVKKAFPINPKEEQDYRYVKYHIASQYLEKTINRIESELSDNLPPEDKCLIHQVLNPVIKTAYLLEKKLGS